MSKNKLLALENEERTEPLEVGEPLSEAQVDDAHAELMSDIAETGERVDQVGESTGISDTIDSIADSVEKTIDEGPALTDAGLEIVNASMEHFYVRLGVTKDAVPALESFDTTRPASVKVAVEQMRRLSNRARRQINVAQEGIVERIGNALARAFSNESQMVKAAVQLKPDQLGEERSLGLPAWGRVFALSGKNPVNGAAVASLVTQFATHAGEQDSELIKALNEAAASAGKILKEFERSNFIANDDAVSEINRIGEKTVAELRKVAASIPQNLKGEKRDIEIVSCDKASMAKIVQGMRAIPHADALEKAYSRYAEAVPEAVYHMRIAGNHAADVKAYEKALGEIDKAISQTMPELLRYRSALMHGAYKYLLVSCKKA